MTEITPFWDQRRDCTVECGRISMIHWKVSEGRMGGELVPPLSLLCQRYSLLGGMQQQEMLRLVALVVMSLN